VAGFSSLAATILWVVRSSTRGQFKGQKFYPPPEDLNVFGLA
jgi:hypothetical protein